MVKLVQWSPAELETLNAHAGTVTPRIPGTVVDHGAEGTAPPSFSEAFGATYERENLTYEALREAGYQLKRLRETDGRSELQKTDRGWNPYRYMRENWDDDARAALDTEVRQGMFDNVTSPEQLERKAANVTREKDLLSKIEGGPALGVVLGGLAGAATDLSSYTPGLGLLTRLRGASQVTKGVLLGTAAAAIPEAGLQYFQELRAAEEAFMNIGVGAALGGGIGAFARVMHPRSRLHPDHPDNPLHPDNLDKQGMAYQTPGGDADVIFPGSVSAARADNTVPGGAKGVFSNVPGARWVTETVTGATPAGRALRWSSGKTRGIVVGLMDLGGQLSERAGFVFKHSAEDVKRDLLVARDKAFLVGEVIRRQLNGALGQNPLAATAGFSGTVDEVKFTDLARKKLLGDWSDQDTQALVREFGEDAGPKIDKAVNDYAEVIHKTNAIFEEELVAVGALRDVDRIESLQTRLDAIAEQEDAVTRQNAGAKAQGDATRTEIGEDVKLAKAELKAELDHEMSKPESLGRDYGHAQLYDPSTIIAKQDDFEDWLLDVLVESPDDDWLLETHRVTPGVWEKLGVEDVAVDDKILGIREGGELRKAILRDWSGDEATFNLYRAERREAGAREAVKQAELDFADTARASRSVGQEVRRMGLSEARKFRDKFNGELEAARASRDALRAEQRAIAAAAEAARSKTLARQNQFIIEPGRDAKPGKTIPGVPALDETTSTAATAARAGENAKELSRASRRLERMEARAERLNDAYEEIAKKVDAAKKARAAIDDALVDAGKANKVATKDLRKAKAELRRLRGKTPLDDAVSRIREALMSRNSLPRPVLDRVAITPGRAKARRLILTKEQRLAGEAAGFLRTDLSAILHNQYEALSGYIGLHKGLDIGRGKTFESWTSVTDSVREEYSDLIRKADPKDVPRLETERTNALYDVNLLKDRILGTENVGTDKDGWVHWLSAKVRQSNFVRFGAGFLPASLTDIASVHLASGPLSKLLREHGSEVIGIMTKMYEGDPSDFVAMFNALELGSQGVRTAQALDASDTFKLGGIGARGTLKHTITSGIDAGGAKVSEFTNVVSGMRLWNRFWKIAAGVHRAHRLRDLVGKFDTLDVKTVDELGQLGIGRGEAVRMHGFIEKFGQVDAKGHFDPNLDEWAKTAQGREAMRDFRVAIERDMNRAVFTPGIGDTPGIMSHDAAKVWLQFQSYAFTFMNRFLVPASQRIATHKDAQALVSFGHLAWSGLMVVLAKDIIRGEDPMKRFEDGEWGNTAKEVVDRSGMLTYLSPYVDSALKLSASSQEAVFGDVVVGPSSRYTRNVWGESALGAGYGLFRDMQAFGAAAADGDTDRILKKGLVLAPANTYFRLMHNLNTSLTD